MKRNRDPLALSPEWHIDLRLEQDLPEDSLIGKRFLVHVVFSFCATTAVIFAGYHGLLAWTLSSEVAAWEQRINDNRAEVADIMRMQREYSAEALKIDQAFALARPQLYVADFIANLGRTRPERLAIDLIEWNDAGVVLRGNLRERSDRATEILGGYVEQLRRDEKIGPLFREIVLTDLDRGATGETLRFEIKFSMKAGA